MIYDNSNMTLNEASKGRFHLNPRSLGSLAINCIRELKRLQQIDK